MRLQESDRKVASVYVLRFSKMGFGTLADNFIALRIMTIKKSNFLLSLNVDYLMGDLLLCLTGCKTQSKDVYGVKDNERPRRRQKQKGTRCTLVIT